MVLSDNTYPTDIRVEKEIQSLTSHGHDVGIVCIRFGTEPEYDEINNIRIWRLRVPLRDVRFFGRALELGIFRHLTYNKIKIIASDFKPHVIHVHDLPLAIVAMKVADRINARFVVDMHEHYVGLLIDRGLKGILGWLVKTVLYREERQVYMHADAIITVVEEHKKRIEREFGIKNRLYVVSNTVDIDKLKPVLTTKIRKKWDLCYVGAISPERGLDLLLSALSKIDTRLNVAIVGSGGGMEKLKRYASQLQHNIIFTGHLPFEDAMMYIRSAVYGVIPYKRTLLTEHTVPHKLFQYMYLTAPPIVSDVTPLKRIVSKEGCGHIFRAEDIDNMADTIEEAYDIYKNRRSEWNAMALRGVRAVERRYNWSVETKKLIDIYDLLEAQA